MALHLNYPDASPNLETEIVGRVMGPDTVGGHVVAVSAERDDDGGVRVRFMPLQEGETRLYLDEHRQVRLPRSAIAEDGTIIPLEMGP